MKKVSFWGAIAIMNKAEDTEEGLRQFNFALGILEKKIGRALSPVFTAISIVFFISAFTEFRGMLDFVFRIIAGLLLVAFSLWGLNRLYDNRPAAFIIRTLSGRDRKRRTRR
jgi:hypothetical protein